MHINQAPKKRIWEIDAWRGAILIYMVFFHLLYDLHFFYGYPCNPYDLAFTPALIVSLAFYPIAGISSGLSRNSFQNGLRCGAAALLLSLVTWLIFPQSFIRFGTLHLLSIAMLLTPLWNRLPTFSLPLVAAICYALGNRFAAQSVTNPWLFPLGLLSPGFSSLDYFPLFPYLAPYLVGVWIFRVVYAPRGKYSLLPEWRWTRPLQFIGRHSLRVYLLHQPIIIALLVVILGMPKF